MSILEVKRKGGVAVAGDSAAAQGLEIKIVRASFCYRF